MDDAVEIPLGGGAVWRPSDGRPPSGQPMTRATAWPIPKTPSPRRSCKASARRGSPNWPKPWVCARASLKKCLRWHGTSPVTLKEMVASYSTLTNSGGYIEPMLVTRIEDRNGKVLETFKEST